MQYSEVLASLKAADESGGFTATIDDSWLQGRSLFGGIQAALGVAAMRHASGVTAPLRSLQTSFIAPVPAGALRLQVQVLRQGRSATQVECRIMDGNQTLCLMLGIFGAARDSSIRITPAVAELGKPIEQADELPFMKGMMPDFLQHMRQRWTRGGFPFTGQPSADFQVHVAMREAVPCDEPALVSLADAIPTPALTVLKQPAMASSLTWTLELLVDQLPDCRMDQSFRFDAVVDAAVSGYANQTATLLAPDGSPIAFSRQAVVIFA